MLQNILPLLESFFGQNIANLYRGQPWRGKGLLMGCPVWGEKYLERFEKYCLPSIMAPKNHETLKGRCRMVLFTDASSYTKLLQFTEGMEDVGFDLDIVLIPNELMATLPKGRDDPEYAQKQLNKYWILGVAQNTCNQMAKRAGMAVHILHPDHVYGPEYFANLFRLSDKYDGIAQTSISANVEACAELDKYIQPTGTLIVPDRELGDIGWRHLHKQTRASLMNTATIPDDLPESHLWTWVGKDKLHLYCCHMNMAYLSAKYVAVAPTRIPATVDAELPSFMPKDFYVPTAEDGMTFIEISDETKADNPRRVGMVDFAKHCWLKTRFSLDWMPYVMKVCEVPIHNQELPIPDVYLSPSNRQKKTWMEPEEIAAQHAELVRLLLEQRGPDTIATEFISGLAFR